LRNDLTAAAGLLAGLRFDAALIKRLFRKEIMVQSSLYQNIVEESEQHGMRLGKLETLNEQLFYKFGILSDIVKKGITDLNMESLARLSKALLEFKSIDDLHAWLKENQQATAGV
jgi:predicted transposase YdaD